MASNSASCWPLKSKPDSCTLTHAPGRHPGSAQLSATTSLSSRYIRIFRPTAAFTGGVAALQLNYSRPLGRQGAVSGGAGFNSTALSGLGAARRASLCALSLTRISSKATFTLLCQFFTLQFPSFTNGDLTTSLAFRQSTGRGAFSVRATGLLTSAYVY
ncbi:hypothetical protein MNEG_11300 [Monoraphidium neglectum]|uniref:Uncharacterized protein n=1 Tax=Monoraphidium neglectum TaxID=145388 RepID=A0A0D2JA97_9CHLO|nr:hypothetical protein MNEG_11300 [Monoraphidium neglectum]KIY96662.1 hypothetical protein MNEG_11300 [Monoraphidium neglectum]|eukprot:XP_013895682.1 hypothetical protein MNEG_11300 [Monoraphidium neglectum]